LNHSAAYLIALFSSWMEFWIEVFYFPYLKADIRVLLIGLGLITLGQIFRVGAMWTAKSNFSHRIEVSKRKEHKLITHGIYRYGNSVLEK